MDVSDLDPILPCENCQSANLSPFLSKSIEKVSATDGGLCEQTDSYTIGLVEAKSSAAAGCPWCKRIVKSFYDSWSRSQSPYALRPTDGTMYVQLEWRLRARGQDFTTGTEPMDISLTAVWQMPGVTSSNTGNPLSGDVSVTASQEVETYQRSSSAEHKIRQLQLLEATTKQAKVNLGQYDSSHCNCAPVDPQAYLPTRVIEVLPSPVDGFVGSDHIKIHVTTPSQRGSYTALSYCWGGERNLMLKSHSLEQMEGGIPIADLPLTIAHAVQFTRMLGLKYLWVDSLCILQDDKEDKRREIRNMRNIYKGAMITIVAAEAHSVYDGFFENPRTFEVLAISANSPKSFLFTSWNSTPTHEPIFTRAWTLEERILPRRVVTFSPYGPFWECQQGNWRLSTGLDCSSDIEHSPSDRIWSGRSDGIRGSPGLYTSSVLATWEYILGDYTRRSLTKPSDKFSAIAGVAEEFAHAWRDDLGTYICGLWSKHLVRGLAWGVTLLSEDRRPPYPIPSHIPSWSWASNNFEVTHVSPEYHQIPMKLAHVKIHDVHSEKTDADDEFLDAAPTCIILEGPIIEAVYSKTTDPLLESTARDNLDVAGPPAANHIRRGMAWPDYAERVSGLTVWALIIWTRTVDHAKSPECSGVILVPSAPAAREDPSAVVEYRRIGSFQRWKLQNPFYWAERRRIALV